MRIGELAQKSGVSRDTIRFYERNGLLTSTVEDSETNSYRNYRDDCLVWLQFFTGARDAGVSVADLRSIVEATAESCDREVARGVIQHKIEELKERADQIGQVIGFLENTLSGSE
ncbi:MerR family transcriptional regulator [Gymnodinialimonas sp. 57CJ19]|uniref:MerR family transcriptional regulator n=1 Tax=Gymnodinialimonas sp. 57CJ19 TaxID=3138498 RepID=UPI0031345644